MNLGQILNHYIASAETKRDWLICGHVDLDKCNVSDKIKDVKPGAHDAILVGRY